MFIIQFFAKLFKILRSGESPNRIAAGFCIGAILGLSPVFTVHGIVLILVLIIVNVNLASALFGMAIFSGLAYLLDPLFHSTGYFLLVDVSFLHAFWTALANIPLIALSRYNNTVVTGSFVVALLLAIPLFPATRAFVLYYRTSIDPKVQKLKIVQVLKSSKFYTAYDKLKGWGE